MSKTQKNPQPEIEVYDSKTVDDPERAAREACLIGSNPAENPDYAQAIREKQLRAVAHMEGFQEGYKEQQEIIEGLHKQYQSDLDFRDESRKQAALSMAIQYLDKGKNADAVIDFAKVFHGFLKGNE